MKTSASFYPPGPAGLPDDLASPTARYRRLVWLVLCSLALFFTLYLGFLAASGWLVYWTWATPVQRFPGRSWVLKGLALALAGLLCFFLVRGLFRRQKANRSLFLEATEAEQPLLHDFIRRLCADTGTPLPHHVYLCPEVNAAAYCDASLFSLFRPIRPSLLIGLGLVNVVTLHEFKAVLAHEFGHFSLRGLRLGRFVYLANRIMDHMGYGLYGWETFLASGCRANVLGAVFCAVPFGLLWLLRQGLVVIFKGINLANLALSREEEFHADLVAVSVTGSDALVHALSRLDFASDALAQTCADLALTAEHKLYSRDLFFHHAHAAGRLRKLRQDARLGLPPELPANPQTRVQVFQPGDDGIPPMWANHPPNHDREQNAKHCYVRSPCDDRSPWLLFGDAEALRAKMTRRWYRVAFKVKKPEVSEPPAVQAFIDAEHAETTFDPKYHGLYDGRFIEPGSPERLKELAAASAWPKERMQAALAALTDEALRQRMEEHRQRRTEHQRLCDLLHGRTSSKGGKHFEFRGRKYSVKDHKKLKSLLKRVEKELKQDWEYLGTLDRDSFLAHYQMARRFAGARDELWTRYDFHLLVQALLSALETHQEQVNAVMSYLATHAQLPQEFIVEAVNTFRAARDALQQCLRVSNTIAQMPALHSVSAGEPFGPRLLDEDVISDPLWTANGIEGWWAKKFLAQLATVRHRLKRFHYKSLGGILAFQERIARGYRKLAPSASDPEVPGKAQD